MEIVPLLHVGDGQVITGGPGKWTPLATPYPDGGTEVVGFARHLFTRFQNIAITDFGAGASGDADHGLYQKLAKQQVAAWVDGLSENLEDVLDLFIAGAERVTVRVDRFDMDELLEVLEMAEGEVWLGYPYTDLADLKNLLREVDPYEYIDGGAAGLVLIDQTRAGDTPPSGVDALQLVRYKDVRVHLAGVVSRLDELERIQEAGGSGVHVGAPLLRDLSMWAERAKKEREADGPPPGTEEPTAAADASGVRVPRPVSPLPGVLPGEAPQRPEDAPRGS